MKLYPKVTHEVDTAPGGAEIAALFDFDGTLISGFSVFSFFREQLFRGELSRADIMQLAGAGAGYGLGNLGFSGLLVSSAKMMRGTSVEAFETLGREVFEKHIGDRCTR